MLRPTIQNFRNNGAGEVMQKGPQFFQTALHEKLCKTQFSR